MNSMKRFILRPPRETPRERLLRMQAHAAPFRRSLTSRPFVLGLALLLFVACLLVLGLLTGTYGAELLKNYMNRLILEH